MFDMQSIQDHSTHSDIDTHTEHQDILVHPPKLHTCTRFVSGTHCPHPRIHFGHHIGHYTVPHSSAWSLLIFHSRIPCSQNHAAAVVVPSDHKAMATVGLLPIHSLASTTDTSLSVVPPVRHHHQHLAKCGTQSVPQTGAIHRSQCAAIYAHWHITPPGTHTITTTVQVHNQLDSHWYLKDNFLTEHSAVDNTQWTNTLDTQRHQTRVNKSFRK